MNIPPEIGKLIDAELIEVRREGFRGGEAFREAGRRLDARLPENFVEEAYAKQFAEGRLIS